MFGYINNNFEFSKTKNGNTMIKSRLLSALLIFSISSAMFLLSCAEDEEPIPPPVAGFDFTVDNNTGNVTFNNTSTDAVSYLWDFGDGNSSTDASPVHTYAENGAYTVVLTATNEEGDTDTETQTVNVELVVPEPDPEPPFDGGLLTNGDFENGADSWVPNYGDADIREEGGNNFLFVDVETATPDQPFLVNISQILELTEGTKYKLSFDASTGEGATRTLIAGIGLNEAPFTAVIETVTLTDETQRFDIELTANFGGANSRVLFDMAGDAGIVVLDNIALVVVDEGGNGGNDSGGDATGLAALPADFEDGSAFTGVFEAGDGVNGETIDNPDQSGINTSAKVYKFVKVQGAAWYSGMFNVFPADLDAATGTTFKVKMWSPKAGINVRFQLEKEGSAGAVVTYQVDQPLADANTWVELTFDFSSTAINLTDGYDKIVIFPDYDEANQVPVAEEAIYYVDDIVQE
jgi:PKD repeat protein